MTAASARSRSRRLSLASVLLVLATAAFPWPASATPTYQGGASAGWGYQEGDVLVVNPGTWTSTTSITYSYAWFNEKSVPLGTGSTYTVAGSDVGHQIYAAIAATDGTPPSLTVNTPTVGPMRYRPPVNVELPTVSGALQQGTTLVATAGKWVSGGSSTAPIQIGYEWYRGCTTDAKPDCSNTGEIGRASSLVLTGAEVGRLISLTVTASYPDGAGGQASRSVWLNNLGPVTSVTPASHTYSSTIEDGARLSGTLDWTVTSVGAKAIAFWADNVRLDGLPADAGGTTTYAFDTTALSDGTHQIEIAVDWLDGSQPSIYRIGFVTIENARAVVKPLIAKPTTIPVRPVAGRRVLVTFRVTRSDNHEPLTRGKMTCDPSLKGQVIAHAESFVEGKARLAFTVPRAARGRLLTVKLTITLGNQSATRIATIAVR